MPEVNTTEQEMIIGDNPHVEDPHVKEAETAARREELGPLNSQHHNSENRNTPGDAGTQPREPATVIPKITVDPPEQPHDYEDSEDCLEMQPSENDRTIEVSRKEALIQKAKQKA